MKRNSKNQEIVITRPSTTLIQSKFVLTSAPLFEVSKHLLESHWLKPHSDAMYMHLFHQMIRQHTKSSPKHKHPHSTPVTSLFIKYFDMPSIAKNIQPCIKSRLSQDNLRPNLNRKVLLRVEQIQKQHEKIKNAALYKIIQVKQEWPLKNNTLTPTFKNKKDRLRFNFLENSSTARTRNALGIIEKKSPLKEQYYGLEPIQKPKTLFKHAKRVSNLTNYHNLDFVFKDELANYPNFPNTTKNSNYYRVGVASQHLTKHTSPQKSLKSSRKSSLKKESMLKKISSQKSVGKKEIKVIRR